MKSDILKSWKVNAGEWNAIIDNGTIPSRKFTNKAILESITSIGPKKVADLGCGEGWLTREMTKLRIEAHGFDGTWELIQLAKKKGPKSYNVLDFESLEKGKLLPGAPYNLGIFNFSIYQKDGLDFLLINVLRSLTTNGVLLIQTLHPFYLVNNGFTYESQWLSDSWKGLPGHFIDGHRWYARTFEEWAQLLNSLKGITFSFKEVIDDKKQPISLIISIHKID